MKILQVHKYLYRKAGAEAYVLDLAKLLTKKGHEVELWSSGEDIDFSKREGLIKDLKKFGHMVWSRRAAKEFNSVLKKFKPDIIHIHNIYHHISPSILPVAKKHKIPVVMTVHDYKLINPNYTLYDHGKICERQGLSAVLHKCIQNSFLSSLAGVVAFKIHKIIRVHKNNIAQYIVPTQFVRGKLIQGGFDKKKIEVVPLLVNEQSKSKKLGDYVLFAGRLTKEKGVYLLLEIAKQLPDIQFMVAGNGPELKNLKVKKSKNVELLGFVEKEKLEILIQKARLVVVPSLWYDPSPYAVLEAMAAGKVVAGSKIGGIQNLIKHKKTGFLIEPDEWVDAIEKLYYDKALLKQTGKAAQKYIQEVHNSEKHYKSLNRIYDALG